MTGSVTKGSLAGGSVTAGGRVVVVDRGATATDVLVLVDDVGVVASDAWVATQPSDSDCNAAGSVSANASQLSRSTTGFWLAASHSAVNSAFLVNAPNCT